MLGSSLVVLLNWRLVDLDALGLNDRTNLSQLVSTCDTFPCPLPAAYPLLELGKVRGAEGVSLCNDGDKIDTRAQSLHDLDIQRLEGVAGGADEVKAGVNAKVNLVLATGLLLLEHVGFVLVVEELDNGHPRVTVVDIVAKAGGVDNGQANCRD